MTTQELSLDAVAHSRSDSCWSVEERAWKQELPELPDDVIALLAAPVVVSASAWAVSVPLARTGDEDEDEPEKYPAPDEPCAATSAKLLPPTRRKAATSPKSRRGRVTRRG